MTPEDPTGATSPGPAPGDDAPARPRRRRVASRPAAPPAETPASPAAESAEPEGEPAPRPRRRRVAARPAAVAPAVTDEAAGQGEPAVTDEAAGRGEPAVTDEAAGAPAPRRRRAVRRPAGAVEPTETPDAPPADAPAVDAPVADAPPPRRRRSRAAAAEPAAPEAALEPTPHVVDAVEDEPENVAAAADDRALPDAPPARPARSRTRAAAAAVTFQPPTVDEDDEPRPRRRRASRPAAPAAFAEPEVTSDAGAASSEADDEEPAPRRRRGRSAGAPERATSEDSDTDSADTDSSESDSEDDSDDGEGEGGRSRRRRRGRRGRGRSRDGGAGGDSDASTGGDSDGSGDDGSGPSDAAPDGDSSDGGDETPSSTKRRRSRRRGGGGGGGGGDDSSSSDTPAKSKEPKESRGRSRATAEDDDGVRGITGSTRMEAKRQRRREGRDSGRRRAPIVSEAEFLARREAVDRVMLVRQTGERTQVAVLEDDVLVEHYVTQATTTSYAGNVYLGKVQNVLPSMEAAFLDVGKGRNGVLYAGEVNWDVIGDGGPRRIESALKSGQDVVVQVSKDPIGHKGARLTSQISLPGRYLVYVPDSSMTGISRKLPDTERARLKAILKKVVPENGGVIVRTAAEGASEEELTRDVERLAAQWQEIQDKAAKSKGPTLLHGEPDLVVRVVRDVFNEDFSRLVVQGDREWETVSAYVQSVAPDLMPRLSRHTGETDLFTEARVDEQLAKALDRKVWLPSGGSLVIDRTEAMIVIDVNTGKFVGKGGNLEETVTKNNLEAAEEIVRQCRLRDLGGIIVIDFIDMVLESNRDLVLRRLTECLGRDRTKHQVAEVTSLGLVQMTRKRVGQGLLEAFSEPCPSCNGRGILVSTTPVASGSGGGNGAGGNGAGGNGESSGGGKGRKARSGPPVPAPPPGVPAAPARRGRKAAAAEADGAGSETDGAVPETDSAQPDAVAPTDADVALPAEPQPAPPAEPAVDAPAVADAAEVVEPATLTPASDAVLEAETQVSVEAGADEPSGDEPSGDEPSVDEPSAADQAAQEPAARRPRRRATRRPAGPPVGAGAES